MLWYPPIDDKTDGAISTSGNQFFPLSDLPHILWNFTKMNIHPGWLSISQFLFDDQYLSVSWETWLHCFVNFLLFRLQFFIFIQFVLTGPRLVIYLFIYLPLTLEISFMLCSTCSFMYFNFSNFYHLKLSLLTKFPSENRRACMLVFHFWN